MSTSLKANNNNNTTFMRIELAELIALLLGQSWNSGKVDLS